MTNKGIGLYIHIPFCEKRCAYCDFYSTFLNKELLENYTKALIKYIKQWGGKINRPIVSVYFGGGTPSLLGELLPDITKAVFDNFRVEKDAEITLEINPSGKSEEIFKYAKAAGVNRISIGAQSGDNEELKLLGRTHTAEDTVKTVECAKKMGFDNISLDIMLGLPHSSNASLEKSLDFITELSPTHISAYILKIEENTYFYKNKDNLNLPDEDSTAQQYLFMCDYLKKKGYRHYEISNFCRDNNTSRHNTLYWQGREYLGLGTAAHSYLDGKRFYYPDDIKGYIGGNSPVFDGDGGGKEEYIMLNLRLDSGINFADYKSVFGEDLPNKVIEKARLFAKAELVKITDYNISLTDKGMLVSNNIIAEILEVL